MGRYGMGRLCPGLGEGRGGGGLLGRGIREREQQAGEGGLACGIDWMHGQGRVQVAFALPLSVTQIEEASASASASDALTLTSRLRSPVVRPVLGSRVMVERHAHIIIIAATTTTTHLSPMLSYPLCCETERGPANRLGIEDEVPGSAPRARRMWWATTDCPHARESTQAESSKC